MTRQQLLSHLAAVEARIDALTRRISALERLAADLERLQPMIGIPRAAGAGAEPHTGGWYGDSY